MKGFARALLALGCLALAVVSAAPVSNEITLDAPSDVVTPGDTLTLRGNQRFNSGQFKNLRFSVGAELVEPVVVDANTVRLIVPYLAPGIHAVRVIKHGDHPGRDIIEFSADILVDGERVLSETSRILSPGGGRLELPGVARAELTEDRSRPSLRLVIEHVSSLGDAALFSSYLESEHLPPITPDTFIRISTTARINGFVGLRVRLPEEIRLTLDGSLEPELYAEVPSFSDVEDMGEYRPLHADYNAVTGELSAPLPGSYFNEMVENTAVTAKSAEAEPLQFSSRIRISVRPYGARHAPVTAIVTAPVAPIVEAGARDTLNLRAQLTIVTPIPLRNPTDYDGPRTPNVRSGFSPAHGGLDIRSRDGDPVYAAADGIVSAIFNNVLPGSPRCNPSVQRGGGWSIAIVHADGTRTSYSHLIVGSELVTKGESVVTGQRIAQADHTGGTCPSGPEGAHLHFGYRIDGIAIDPLPFIKADPATFQQLWLDQLSVIAVVDGTPIENTRRAVTSKEFSYAAPLDLSALDLQPNRTYPLSLRLVTQDGQTANFYSGTLRVKPTALRVILTWDKANTDVDLHVRDSNGNHAWYRNLTGIPGGHLDHDDTDGFGPEVFTLEKLEPNTSYSVILHYYSDKGNGPTTARAIVYLDNNEVTNTEFLLNNNEFVGVGIYSNDAP
jgi:murein DD-endopeptidase MepM/ murein hydrolase activator NlpD